jgi:glycosyltransferase involved in cell wall biosynthesis
MATYNGERFIEAQLKSILGQLSEEDELIISDDGSTDDTVRIIDSFQDSRIRLYHSGKRDLISNFENALRQVRGDYVFLSDQDDIWFDNKVETLKEALKSHILVFTNAQLFDKEITSNGTLLYQASNRTGFWRNIIKNNFIGATMAFRTDLLRSALPFPKYIPMHDSWLGLMAELKGKTAYIADPLIYYRRHERVVSTTGTRSKNSLIKKMAIRLKFLYSLLNRVIFHK